MFRRGVGNGVPSVDDGLSSHSNRLVARVQSPVSIPGYVTATACGADDGGSQAELVQYSAGWSNRLGGKDSPLVDQNFECVVLRCVPEDFVGLEHLGE
jgi:hypothetical protein